MRVTKGQLIAGFPALKMRDFFRHDVLSEADFEHRFGVDADEARRGLEKLCLEGYLERKGAGSDQWYESTELGLRLGCASGAPPIARAKAARMLEDLKKRIEHINRHKEFVLYVPRLIVFGSFLDESKNELGDLDVAVDLKHKPGMTLEDEKAQTRLDLRNGKRVGRSFIEQLTWQTTKIWLFLKSRQQGLSLHDANSHKEFLEGKPMKVFEFQVAQPQLVASKR